METDGDRIRGVQKCLRTVLDDIDVMRFRHQSFVDFLTSAPVQANYSPTNDPTACPERFHIDIAAAHGRVCDSLFRVMNEGLRFNICQIPSSFMHNGTLCWDGIQSEVRSEVRSEDWFEDLSRTLHSDLFKTEGRGNKSNLTSVYVVNGEYTSSTGSLQN